MDLWIYDENTAALVVSVLRKRSPVFWGACIFGGKSINYCTSIWSRPFLVHASWTNAYFASRNSMILGGRRNFFFFFRNWWKGIHLRCAQSEYCFNFCVELRWMELKILLSWLEKNTACLRWQPKQEHRSANDRANRDAWQNPSDFKNIQVMRCGLGIAYVDPSRS